MTVAIILAIGFGASFILSGEMLQPGGETTLTPSIPGETGVVSTPSIPSAVQYALLGACLLALVFAVYFIVKGCTWDSIRKERSFALLIILGTFVLPQLSAFPVRLVGWLVPTNASQVMGLTTTNIFQIATFLVPLFIISVVIGLLWNSRQWLINAAIFYGLFILFYTSLFTNGAGFLTGMVGSLGYWLEQQGVNRGSQPGYYYWLVQIPVYEYLPAIGTILAFIALAVKRFKPPRLLQASEVPTEDYLVEDMILEEEGDLPGDEAGGEVGLYVTAMAAEAMPAEEKLLEDSQIPAADEVWDHKAIEPESQASRMDLEDENEETISAIGFLVFWAITSLVAYSIAGEKMPWLTVHIALPMILSAAWYFGSLVEGTDWSQFKKPRGWLYLVLLPVFFLSLKGILSSLLGTEPPFQGQSLEQLQATSTFLTSLLAIVASGASLFYLAKSWAFGQTVRLFGLFLFSFLGLLTARTAFQAAYINYDNANELLVYAHSAGGVKTALEQIEEISLRTTDGYDVVVAYDNDTSYPYWWYLRNYRNARYYGADPTRSLRDAPLILVGANNFGKIEPVVANLYYPFEYIRLWWPNQDYYGLTWERVRNAITNPEMRAAVFEIWLNRDYTLFGQVTGRDLSLTKWSPSDRMRLYIRKDIVASIWDYGVTPSAEILQTDPFEGKGRSLTAEIVLGSVGTDPGQFQRPRDLEVAPDGSLYIADTDNHRIQHITESGEVVQVWGSFGDVTAGVAPGGTFNQPWGIALGGDGSVYVADTWNHRIQKFNAEGEFITMWGMFGQAETPTAFWGPRDVAVTEDGQVLVTDTGNKRIVVFDEQGNFIAQFGSPGMNAGEFDEPVGLVLDTEGKLYVADTWNQRVQVFVSDTFNFLPLSTWDLTAWYGQSLDNKPYLDVDENGNIFIADPEGYRVLVLSADGQALYYWGDYGSDEKTFAMPASVALDGLGGIWVTDAGNSRVMYFKLPE